MQGGGHEGVLGHRVAPLGEHDRPDGDDRPVDLAVVPAVGGLDLEAERPQRRHVRFDGAGAEVAAPGVGELEGVGPVEQRAEEHQDRAGTARGLLVDPGEVEVLGWNDLEVVLGVDPPGLDAEAAEHLEQPVDLLDPRDLAERRAAAVEQRGAQQRDTGVLRRLDVDRAGQRGRSLDPEVGGPGAQGDDLGVEGGADPGEHLERQVLVTLLDAVDGALAGAELLGELGLGQSAMLARVADQVADATLVVGATADRMVGRVVGVAVLDRRGDCHATTVTHI